MQNLIDLLQSLPAELLWLISLIGCLSAIVLVHKLFGTLGIAVYVSVAMIVANIQVLKLTPLSPFSEPIALGTIFFTTIFFATDLVAEINGPKAARRIVFASAFAALLWVFGAIITIGYPNVTPEQLDPNTFAWQQAVQSSLETLLTPAPAIFTASWIAFITSQLLDIFLFERIRRKTGSRHLWLRNNVSTFLSTLIDNAIFSTLAFVIFAQEPLTLRTLIVQYILLTWILRLVVSLGDTPFLYLGRWLCGGSRGRTSTSTPSPTFNAPT